MENVHQCGSFRDACESIAKPLRKPCICITMERYFVAVIVVCFVLSLISLFASVVVNVNRGIFRKIVSFKINDYIF